MLSFLLSSHEYIELMCLPLQLPLTSLYTLSMMVTLSSRTSRVPVTVTGILHPPSLIVRKPINVDILEDEYDEDDEDEGREATPSRIEASLSVEKARHSVGGSSSASDGGDESEKALEVEPTETAFASLQVTGQRRPSPVGSSLSVSPMPAQSGEAQAGANLLPVRWA